MYEYLWSFCRQIIADFHLTELLRRSSLGVYLLIDHIEHSMS